MIDSQTIRKRNCLQGATKKGKKKFITIILCAVLATFFVALACKEFRLHNRSVYQTLVSKGYQGTQEQLLASLVGEEADSDNEETAYKLAVENGYKGSEMEWVETLVGDTIDSINIHDSPYILACKNGFEGTLTEWLTKIADNPEKLGKSDEKDKQTEYELACVYGYSGTFIEWLVSLTNDRIF